MDITTLKEVKQHVDVMADVDEVKAYIQDEIYKIEPPVETIYTCTSCILYKDSVAIGGAGDKDAQLMIVGEAPYQDDELTGLPFSGASGQMLDSILTAAKLNREDIYITNVLKHKLVDEKKKGIKNQAVACYKWLEEEIRNVNPDVILCLGLTASTLLIKPQFDFANDRGVWHKDNDGRSLIGTYHPAYLCRLEGETLTSRKKEVWSDILKVLERLKEEKP
jgi:uracil-DNA glycosylase